MLSPSAQSPFVPSFPPPCLQLQIVAAIVLSFQVLKFLVLWLHGPFSVRSASSTPFLLFHSLFCNQEKKKRVCFTFSTMSFLSECEWMGRRGKKSLSGVGWSKCLFPHMTEKISIPLLPLCSKNILTGSWAWLMQRSHYREVDNCVLACNAPNITSHRGSSHSDI